MRKEYAKGIDELKRSIILNPNNADGYCELGWALTCYDRHNEGIDHLKKAILLNPYPPAIYYMLLGYAYRAVGDYEKSIETLRKSIEISPKDLFSHVGLAAAYALAGREKDARSAVAEVLRINPEFSVEKHIERIPQINKQKAEFFADALYDAGLK